MNTGSNVLPMAARTETVDLFHHPLASDGFYPRYCLVGYPAPDGEKPYAIGEIEVLIDQERGAAFTAEAERLGERFALSRPVCEAYPDHDGGPWYLIAAAGPRALVGELMLLAQRIGCERRAWT